VVCRETSHNFSGGPTANAEKKSINQALQLACFWLPLEKELVNPKFQLLGAINSPCS
jgi:hypothetical protein